MFLFHFKLCQTLNVDMYWAYSNIVNMRTKADFIDFAFRIEIHFICMNRMRNFILHLVWPVKREKCFIYRLEQMSLIIFRLNFAFTIKLPLCTHFRVWMPTVQPVQIFEPEFLFVWERECVAAHIPYEIKHIFNLPK